MALAYPEAETIHLVMDNLSTHSRKSLTDLWRRGVRRRDLGLLHAALHAGAWQLVEIRRRSRSASFRASAWASGAFRTWRRLRREAAAWKRRVNREQVKIDWRFDRKAARKTFGYKRPVYQAVRELE